MVNVNDSNFNKEVVDKSKDIPVLVDFWAPWCPPCVMLSPVLEEAINDSRIKGKLILAKANTGDCEVASSKYGIMHIPAVKLFKDGKVVDEFIGFRPKNEIIDWLIDRI